MTVSRPPASCVSESDYTPIQAYGGKSKGALEWAGGVAAANGQRRYRRCDSKSGGGGGGT